MLVHLLPPIASAQSSSDGVYLSLLLASDFKLHGLSQTNSRPAIRFSADYEHETGLFAGGYIANVEFEEDRIFASRRDSVVNAYAGYIWRGSRWSTTASASRYAFPHFGPDLDYTEMAANLSYRSRYFLSYSRSSDYASIGQPAEQIRLGVSMPWIQGIEASINAGRFESDRIFDIGYSYYDAGLSRVFGRLALDLRYHDDTYDRGTVIGETGIDRWVFSMSYPLSPQQRGLATPAPDN